uniref:Succinate dehydrogenase cytochrome b560 subunit, mitochondrial n=1 Tax=Phaeomonas parva TaxID=124430 RepID=A0A7S1XVJ2_9STRA|mmetsp:Transcript_36761/g.115132  ORF Transcript_36761/g.115132 Transcript_36761/m.115132 type:complete len:180 (+) Transcript_36761:129-668(+)|eukprot:CAMPEP_0118885858 /NCGR_PEP_ID=MMETSP1163-20130328/24158_1 /TAXON_ID=124430 /ORGANISM="Phaeomonas parva, Strain CCMP2877" /LENGTH=179 /DNA_ID=CAMNT_0006823937 /DNA_START=122 /DNA_END=661 /DNA_ORIENTATION=+
MALRGSVFRLSPALARIQPTRQLALRSALLGRRVTAPSALVPLRDLATAPSEEKYSARQKKTGRPVSPHVTIYAFPAVAISSISVRVTGCILSVGLGGIGALALVGVDTPALMSAVGSSAIGPLAKFAVSYSLVYHFFGAARHYVWDQSPEMLENDQVYQTSLGIMGAAGVISAGLAFM